MWRWLRYIRSWVSPTRDPDPLVGAPRGVIALVRGYNVTIESQDGATTKTFVVDGLTRITIDGIHGNLSDVKVGDLVAYRVRDLFPTHLRALGVLG